MAAYFDSGFCVRQPSWHRQEVLLQENPETWDDGRLAAGLMWEPREFTVYRKVLIKAGEEMPKVLGVDGEIINATETVLEEHADGSRLMLQAIENLKGVERDDSKAVLGVRSSELGLITHADMGEIADVIIKEFGPNMKIDTMGSCRGGRQVWAVLCLDEPFQVLRDVSLTFPLMALLNHHAGTGSFKVVNTRFRVVCANTFQQADEDGDTTGTQIVIRHTGNMEEKKQMVKDAIADLRSSTERWKMTANELASINVNDAFVKTFAEWFIPTPENPTPRVENDRNERRALFMHTYDWSPTMEGIRGTAYGVYQCAGEYLDHLRPYRNADTYLARTLLRPEPIKGRVLKLVREMVASGVD